MAKNIEYSIGNLAGEAVKKKIIEKCGQITEKSSKRELGEWVKCAMENLDALVDEKNRHEIMEACGRNCAEINRKTIENAKARRNKFKSLDEFLEAEIHKPMRGTILQREGNMLHWFYIPHALHKSLRCYCGLLRGLPESENVSSTYCHCSCGFVKTFWESVLGKPVEVELVHSAMSGARDCEFTVSL